MQTIKRRPWLSAAVFLLCAGVMGTALLLIKPSQEARAAAGTTGSSVTLQSGAAATGSGTIMNVAGLDAVRVTVTQNPAGTWVLTFEESTDGINWDAVNAMNQFTGAVATTATVTGSYLCPASGATLFRARVSSYTSGQISATAIGTAGADALSMVSPLPASKPSGGLRNVSTAVAIKTSPGTLMGLHVENNQAAAVWIQVFDATVANVTLGTTNPDKEYLIAANASLDVKLPAGGVAFTNAITIASTTAEKGNTGSAAGVQVFPDFE